MSDKGLSLLHLSRRKPRSGIQATKSVRRRTQGSRAFHDRNVSFTAGHPAPSSCDVLTLVARAAGLANLILGARLGSCAHTEPCSGSRNAHVGRVFPGRRASAERRTDCGCARRTCQRHCWRPHGPWYWFRQRRRLFRFRSAIQQLGRWEHRVQRGRVYKHQVA